MKTRQLEVAFSVNYLKRQESFRSTGLRHFLVVTFLTDHQWACLHHWQLRVHGLDLQILNYSDTTK